jgi:hypothetical protein
MEALMMEETGLRPIEPEDLEFIAVACGVLRPGEKISPELLEYTATVVFHCAAVVGDVRSGEADPHDALLNAFGLVTGPTH